MINHTIHVAATKVVHMQKKKENEKKENVELIPTSLHKQIKNPNVNFKTLKEKNRQRIFLLTYRNCFQREVPRAQAIKGKVDFFFIIILNLIKLKIYIFTI